MGERQGRRTTNDEAGVVRARRRNRLLDRAGAIDRRTWRSSAEARTETARAARAGATPARSERVAARGAEVRETGVTRTATIVRAQGIPRAG